MIKITEKYYIDTDKYNWILCEKHIVTEKEAENRKNAQAGDIEYKNISYHMSLEQLLTSFLEKHKRAIAKEYDLKGYIQELKHMQEDFLKQIKKIKEVEQLEDTYKKILYEIVNHYTKEGQVGQAIEEMAELIVELNKNINRRQRKYNRNKR